MLCNVSIASLTSKVLPTASPNGSCILVITALVSLLNDLPIPTNTLDKLIASSKVFMNAPDPTFTSNKIVLDPLASFFDIIDEAIKGTDPTVDVTSLKAYNFLSAGTMFPV